MPGSSIYCRRLLSGSRWLSDVRLSIDEAGIITRIEGAEPSHSDIVLEGPVIPGMPNCHSHAFQRQMAGLAGFPGPDRSDSFWTWRETMYELANRLDADQFESIAAELYCDMVEAGYTSCAEFHYVHHQPNGQVYQEPDELGARLLAAADQAGLALTLVPILYCRSGFNETTFSPHQARFINQPEQFLAIFEKILSRVEGHSFHRAGLGIHSLRAVSPEQMKEVLGAEKGRAAAIHIHVAEQPAEVEQSLQTYGARPVEWLLENAAVNERWCLVHATHMSGSEYRQVADSGAVVGLCPTTEADLGDGFFEAENFLHMNGSMAIGSDSNLRISPCEELRILEFGLRLRTGKRNVFAKDPLGCGMTLYNTMVKGGGAALGQPVGELVIGNRADLLELDPEHPMLSGVQDADLLERYVFAGEKRMIRSVFVAGCEQVRNGVHIKKV